ncbi:glycoside hydrolase family protein, partial [Stenotrophomonas maltophilia]
ELSLIGRAVLIAREGARLEAYRDSVGVWTIGVGHTSAAGAPKVTPGLTITAQECDAIFERDVARFART